MLPRALFLSGIACSLLYKETWAQTQVPAIFLRLDILRCYADVMIMVKKGESDPIDYLNEFMCQGSYHIK